MEGSTSVVWGEALEGDGGVNGAVERFRDEAVQKLEQWKQLMLGGPLIPQRSDVTAEEHDVARAWWRDLYAQMQQEMGALVEEMAEAEDVVSPEKVPVQLQNLNAALVMTWHPMNVQGTVQDLDDRVRGLIDDCVRDVWSHVQSDRYHSFLSLWIGGVWRIKDESIPGGQTRRRPCPTDEIQLLIDADEDSIGHILSLFLNLSNDSMFRIRIFGGPTHGKTLSILLHSRYSLFSIWGLKNSWESEESLHEAQYFIDKANSL